MAELEQVRLAWNHFERKDKPAFARWRAREFGPLLSDAREVEEQIRDAQALIDEVEREMRRAFQNPYTAYQRVMFRRENPAAAVAEEEAKPEATPTGPRPLSEFEKEALFQDWVKQFLGTHPDKLDDRAYTESFEVFKSHMFFAPREEPKPRNRRAGDGPPPPKPRPDEEAEGTPAEELAQIDARVKELYRKLVRRLHPDLRADGSADVSGLWHEVQEAYAASDVPRLEILIALSEIQLDELGEGTTLGQMQAVQHELERSLRALRKSLLEAQEEEPWDFARRGPSEELFRRVERQLSIELSARKQRRDLLVGTVNEWARGPERNPVARVRHSFA